MKILKIHLPVGCCWIVEPCPSPVRTICHGVVKFEVGAGPPTSLLADLIQRA